MNKSAIQRFAMQAREDLLDGVKQRAYQYGITADGYGERNAVTVGGHALSSEEQRQRRELVDQIVKKGYTQVMEEVAYTWFNRFIALRFMEVNNYLPSHIRVFSDSTGAFKPEILNDVLHLELPGLNMDRVAEYIEKNQRDDLYRYLLLTQCNALNEALPQMFEQMGGYTELLLPHNILKQDSVLGHMVTDIPEEDWTDQVQIIGWLYQYYNTKLNEVVYDGNMSKSRIPKELLPAATTIYTPDWAIRYMVENSLGRIYIDKRKNEGIFADGRGADEMTPEESEAKRITNEKYIAEQMGWKYYLPEAEQTQEVRAQLDEIQKGYANLDVKEIKVIDPCMGSGHILVYAFDVLMQIYEANGYSQRDAAQSILENNLYGLDIDDRAAQLAYFAVMMKARQYDRRIFSRGIQPHVYAIVESNGLDGNTIDYFTNNDPKLEKDFGTLMDELRDAKEYGSILNISQVDFAALYARVEEVQSDISLYRDIVLNSVLPLIQVAEVMAQKYDVVVTNPPYLGSSRFSVKLNDYVVANYPDAKADLSMVMYKHALRDMCQKNGFVSFITTTSWMFLSSFEKFRSFVLAGYDFESLVDFGTELFDGKVGHNQIVAWVNRKSHTNHSMTGIRLVDYCYSRRDEKKAEFFNKRNYHHPKQSNFSKIPGSPVAYWVSNRFIKNFDYPHVDNSHYSGGRNKTHNNEKYTRMWWEIADRKRWQLYVKGGDFRRWYGNHEVLDWSDAAKSEYDSHGGLYNQEYAGHTGICWTLITSAKTAFRLKVPYAHYDSGAPTIFNTDFTLDETLLGFLNSNVATEYLRLMNPTINMGNTYVLSLPNIDVGTQRSLVKSLVRRNIELCKIEWDSYELSMEFMRHPMVRLACQSLIAEIANDWDSTTHKWFYELQSNEETLNGIFADLYGLKDEIVSTVPDRDVSIRISNLSADIRSLISYAVGCMFGRYSLDKPGLAYAGGDFDAAYRKDRLVDEHGNAITFGGVELAVSKDYTQINVDGNWVDAVFPVDADNIIPICDDDYFDDDITGRFVKWVETVYGKDTLEENLKFIADALGGKGTPREVIRSYFINDFYADHLKIYQKRPIYWLFDSGKKNGFKALIYMHRYQSDLLARMRTDYVHEQQERYRTQLTHLADAIDHATAAERVKLTKQQKKIQEQALEIQKYEEKIHHLADQNIQIDLDDGVKHNYALFADVLAKIK